MTTVTILAFRLSAVALLPSLGLSSCVCVCVSLEQELQRLAQLDRVLSKAGGAALLCGAAGVGRKAALALAAYMHHMEVCGSIHAWHVDMHTHQ